MDEFDRQRSAGPPDPAEVLVLGSPRRPTHLSTGRRALLAGVAVLVLVACVLTWQWREAASPTFTTEEIADVYRSLPPAGGPTAWDATTFSVEDAAEEGPRESDQKAAPCDQAYSTRLPPASAGRVSIELKPVGAAGANQWSGSAITFIYPTPELAREKFRRINTALSQCQFAKAGSTSIQINGLTTGPDTRARSVTRVAVGLAWSRNDLGVNLVRFGNTVTWVVQGEDAEMARADAVADLVMSQLDASRRAR